MIQEVVQFLGGPLHGTSRAVPAPAASEFQAIPAPTSLFDPPVPVTYHLRAIAGQSVYVAPDWTPPSKVCVVPDCGIAAAVESIAAERGMPGDGCDDPRETHPHWCGFCGAKLLFAADDCRLLTFVPACPRCGEQQWRNEVDELTAPDYRQEWKP